MHAVKVCLAVGFLLVREAQLRARDLDSIWSVIIGEGENQGR